MLRIEYSSSFSLKLDQKPEKDQTGGLICAKPKQGGGGGGIEDFFNPATAKT